MPLLCEVSVGLEAMASNLVVDPHQEGALRVQTIRFVAELEELLHDGPKHSHNRLFVLVNERVTVRLQLQLHSTILEDELEGIVGRLDRLDAVRGARFPVDLVGALLLAERRERN